MCVCVCVCVCAFARKYGRTLVELAAVVPDGLVSLIMCVCVCAFVCLCICTQVWPYSCGAGGCGTKRVGE